MSDEPKQETGMPLKISEKRIVSMPLFVLIALIVTAAGWGMAYLSIVHRIDKSAEIGVENSQNLAHMHARVDAIEQDRSEVKASAASIAALRARVDAIDQQREAMGVIQNDVNWIKQTLLQMRQDLKRTP